MLVIYASMACYWQLLFAAQPETWFPPAIWLMRATSGLINVTLTVAVVNQLVIVGALLFGLCGFRPGELGLDLARLPAAAGLTMLFWAVSQGVLVLMLAILSQPIVLNPEWTAAGWTWPAGQWLGQLLGNSFFEEVVFRGFLMPQCILLILTWMPKARLGLQVAMALLLSQGIFALAHVLFNLRQPQGQWLLLLQFMMGLAFAGIYLRTGNLFLAMGVHALTNNPGPLIQEPFPGPGMGGGIMMLGALLAVVFGPRLVKFRFRRVSQAEPGAAPHPARDGGCGVRSEPSGPGR